MALFPCYRVSVCVFPFEQRQTCMGPSPLPANWSACSSQRGPPAHGPSEVPPNDGKEELLVTRGGAVRSSVQFKG